MLDLVKFVVNQFAEMKDQVEYNVEEKANSIEITVTLVESDMGKVIGKQGKIAKALRTLIKSATPPGTKKYVLEIKEKANEQ